MDKLLDVATIILLGSGSFLMLIGALGLWKLPDFYTRVHAASMIDTLGAWLLIGGLLIQSPDWSVFIKLLLILVFLFFTTPVSSHALVRAAMLAGLNPKFQIMNEDHKE